MHQPKAFLKTSKQTKYLTTWCSRPPSNEALWISQAKAIPTLKELSLLTEWNKAQSLPKDIDMTVKLECKW